MRSHHSLILLASLFTFACGTNRSTDQAPKDPQTKPASDPTPQADPSAATESSPQEIDLAASDDTLTVSKGTILRYSYQSHASVGLGARFEIGDPAVVAHLRTDTDYVQSEEERADKDGADRASAAFVFAAAAAGETSLKIEETMRGKAQETRAYTITVTE